MATNVKRFDPVVLGTRRTRLVNFRYNIKMLGAKNQKIDAERQQLVTMRSELRAQLSGIEARIDELTSESEELMEKYLENVAVFDQARADSLAETYRRRQRRALVPADHYTPVTILKIEPYYEKSPENI